MASPESRDITKEDIESLAEKLDAFAASLPTTERSLLALAISNAARAKAPREKAERFGNPFASTLGEAVSFAEGRLQVPAKIPTLNPGKLRAKDDDEFQGFSRKE
jgi:hypothetical protein